MTCRRRGALALLVLVPVLLALGSCDEGDHVASPFVDKEEAPTVDDLGAISGTVLDPAGQPVPFARVSVGEQTGFADDLGRFFLANLDLGEGIARFAKDTRTSTNFRALDLVAGGEVNFPGIALLPLQRGAVFFADQGGEASLGSLGSGAVFADSSFVDGEEIYTDRVAAFMAEAVAGQPHFAAAFPGDFTGIRDDGSEIPLAAIGVIWTTIDSQAGLLDLAPGKTAVFRLGIDPEAVPPPPASAVAWSLDLATGRWREIGESTLGGGVYEIEAASIAPVCWAVEAADRCAVTGIVQDSAGRPLAGARVECRDLQGRFRQATMSAEDGSFSLLVPPADGARVTPYFGSIAGAGVTIDTVADCPAVIADPLTITLPDYRVDLVWTGGYGDLDAWYTVAGEWRISYVSRGSLESAPYARFEDDERAGGAPETIVGRRWYDGTSEYWVHDYQNRDTASLRESGATVDLVINDELWSFAVADVPFDPAGSDPSGWWHVFDVTVSGTSVAVDTVQAFAPAPDRR